MASEAQVNANRSNAQKSTGPRTPEGKAAVTQNAVKHGLLAQAAVLREEERDRYTHHHEEMMKELCPEGLQETEWAERIVDLSWRLGRAARYEKAVFEALCDQAATAAAEAATDPDSGAPLTGDLLLGRMLVADFSGPRILERTQLYERRIESSLFRARAELRKLQELRAALRAAQMLNRAPARTPRNDTTNPGFPSPASASRPLTPALSCETKPIPPEAGDAGRQEAEQTKPIAGREIGDTHSSQAVIRAA